MGAPVGAWVPSASGEVGATATAGGRRGAMVWALGAAKGRGAAAGWELAKCAGAVLVQGARQASTDLRSVLAEKIPEQQERLKLLKKNHGEKKLGEVTVGMCIGGMRGINVSRGRDCTHARLHGKDFRCSNISI